jgi:4-hydroxy-tetrahydrodipicolinate synthase
MPAMISKLVRACQAGDYPAAAALQIRHVELMRRLFVETHPIPIITAMNLAGMGAGPMRLPLCPLEPEHEQMLARAMRASGFDV